MKTAIHVWPQEWVMTPAALKVGVTVENPFGYRLPLRLDLWYRIPIEHQAAVSSACDAFAVALVFLAMQESRDLVIHGQVSPSLLRNLHEFQTAWHTWQPKRYRVADVRADTEQEDTSLAEEAAVVAYSRGVDGAFSLVRHAKGLCGRWTRRLKAAVLVHGFDTPLHDIEAMRNNEECGRRAVSSLGVEFITVATNFRELPYTWEDSFGPAIASCLTLLKRGYSAGLIGSDKPYDAPSFRWGSNPLTNPLLSSRTFDVVYDGAGFARTEKCHEVARWPALLKELRVCWAGEPKDRNCGRCEKCIRTILNFRAAGCGLPECFPNDVSDEQIARLELRNETQLMELKLIVRSARKAGIAETWVDVIEQRVAEYSVAQPPVHSFGRSPARLPLPKQLDSLIWLSRRLRARGWVR